MCARLGSIAFVITMFWRLPWHLPPSLSLLLRRPVARSFIILMIVLSVAHWVLVLATIDYSNPGLVLHYNLYFGIDWVGSWLGSLIWPVVATGLTIMDIAIATWLMKRDHWLAQGLLLAGVLTTGLLLAVSALVRWQFR